MAKLAAPSHHTQLLQAVCQLEAVVRSPADDEHRYQRDDETERLAPLTTSGVAQRPEDLDVAVEHDEQGKTKTQTQADKLQAHLPLVGIICEPHLAHLHLLVVIKVHIHHLFECNVNSAQAEAHHPNGCTCKLSVAGAAFPPGPDGVNDGQVTVEADTSQEEDAAVAVQREESTRNLANCCAKHPLIDPLHCKQGQSEGQQEVRNGQVQEEGVCQGEGAGSSTLGVSVASDHTQHQDIANNSQDKNQAVHNGGVVLRKTIDALWIAWRCNHLISSWRIGVINTITLIIQKRKEDLSQIDEFLIYIMNTFLSEEIISVKITQFP